MQVTTNFWLEEFVFPAVFKKFGNNAIWFIDHRIITIAQFIRSRFNVPITINNKHEGGPYSMSGLRPPEHGFGARYSQHKFGRAIDVKGVEPSLLRDDILKHQKLYMDVGLTTIEADTPTWTHLDCRETQQDKILIVPYK